MKTPEIVVIGGANLDIKARPTGGLISATSNPGRISISAGGVARNIAHNLAKLGLPVSLITALGRDPAGDQLCKETEAAGVDMSMALVSDQPSGVYCAVLDPEGELAIGVNGMDIIDGMVPGALASFKGAIAGAKYVVIDCNVPMETLEWVCQATRGGSARVIVETVSVAKSEKLKLLLKKDHRPFAATPNLQQAEAITGLRITKTSDIMDVARALQKMGLDNAIVTLGEEGAFLVSGKESAMIPPFEISHRADVTGAGDATTAGMIFALMKGASLFEAAHFGQAAGKLAVESAATVSEKMSPKILFSLVSGRMDVSRL
jgi:pseudouridine kinase